jgi:uncharacterized protein (DUF1800 family)
LFTIGVGNFSESDVKDAARALTGWTVEDGQFTKVLSQHDSGVKTILGQTGRWTAQNLIALLLRQPATAERIATKLCRLFFGEQVAAPPIVHALAVLLREQDLDIGKAFETVLRSRLFFCDANIGNRVLAPAEYVAGAVRLLDLFDPAPSTLALADWCVRMGQDLFDPPNVGGWPAGRAWIHSRSLIARANFSAALMGGRDAGLPAAYDPAAAPQRNGFGNSPSEILTFYHRLLFGVDPGDDVRRQLGGADGSRIVAALLSSPRAQLG